jgi:hypothetical protein
MLHEICIKAEFRIGSKQIRIQAANAMRTHADANPVRALPSKKKLNFNIFAFSFFKFLQYLFNLQREVKFMLSM